MSPRGGKREGSGRPSRHGWTAKDHKKITVDSDTFQLIKDYSKELGLPTIDLMHEVTHHPDFNALMGSITQSLKQEE